MHLDLEETNAILDKNSAHKNNTNQALVQDSVKQEDVEIVSSEKNIYVQSALYVANQTRLSADELTGATDASMPKDGDANHVTKMDSKMGAKVGRVKDINGALKDGAKIDAERTVYVGRCRGMVTPSGTSLNETEADDAVLEKKANSESECVFCSENYCSGHVHQSEQGEKEGSADDKKVTRGVGYGKKMGPLVSDDEIDVDADDEADEGDDDENGPGTYTVCLGRRQWGSIHPPDVDTLIAERSPSMVAEAMQADVKHLEKTHRENLDEVDYRRQWGSIHYPDVDNLLAQRSPSIVSELSSEWPEPVTVNKDSDVEVLSTKTWGNELNVPRVEHMSLDHDLYDIAEEEVVEEKKPEDEVSDGHEYVCQLLGCRTQVCIR
jgi:hypothetical protein